MVYFIIVPDYPFCLLTIIFEDIVFVPLCNTNAHHYKLWGKQVLEA